MPNTVRFPDYLPMPAIGEEGEGAKDDATQDAGKTYDEKYVKELRAENKNRREENANLRKEFEDFKNAQVERDKALKASLGIKDDKEDPIEAMRARMDTMSKKLEESEGNIAKEKLFNAFTGEALKAGVNPDLIGDAWRLTDGVTQDNVKEVVEGLKKSKPFLFAKKQEDVGDELQPGKGDKVYPPVLVMIAKDQRQPVEWIEEKAKEYGEKHKIKNIEQAAIGRFGKPTVVDYKPRT